MMRGKIVFIICFILLSSISEIVSAQLPPAPDGRRLRQIVADKYSDGDLIIGGTTGQWAFYTKTGKILDREFSYVTPENDFKQHTIHPDNSTWAWTKPDKWVSHIISKRQTLRMHCPIGPQCSNWAKNDYRTAEELETNLRAFMEAVCKRYNGKSRFEYMDVVNETVADGAWFKNKTGTDWEMPWYIIGLDTDVNKTPLYIKYAFEIAKEYAPDVKLIYNQHEGTIKSTTWSRIKRTIAYLREMGLRVDGIGWQGHVDVGWEKIEGQQQALRDLIDWAHQNDLEFHVTEASVFLISDSPSSREAQAETYKAILDILIEKSANGKVGWNIWHIDDGNTWQEDKFPSMFDDEFKPKPAYYAVQLALEAKGDYDTPYEVKFKVDNTESGKPIEGCQVVFNNDTAFTSPDGVAVFNNVTANLYDVNAEKRFYNTFSKFPYSVYSDTLFTMSLDSAEILYNVGFHIEDNRSGAGVPNAAINVDTVSGATDFSGDVVFSIASGIHTVKVSRDGYKDYESEINISSDSTIAFQLIKSKAYIKFKLKCGSKPVNKALVVLNGDSMYTSSIGIATYRSLPVDSSYSYFIEKENYKGLQGSLTLFSDTTLNLKIEKLQSSTIGYTHNKVKVFPNPANNYICFETGQSNFNIEIFNSSGAFIKSFYSNSSILIVHTENLQSGVYIARVLMQGGHKPVKLPFIIHKE